MLLSMHYYKCVINILAKSLKKNNINTQCAHEVLLTLHIIIQFCLQEAENYQKVLHEIEDSGVFVNTSQLQSVKKLSEICSLILQQEQLVQSAISSDLVANVQQTQ